MIVIHIDSQKDTSFLKKCYEGIEGVNLLYNPSKDKVNETLKANPGESVMMLGHGSRCGLFSFDWKGDVIDSTNAELLKDRDCIGIWCYAKEFGRKYGLKGYFTSMFISNEGEARGFGYKATEEEVFAEVETFANRINELIKAEVPLTDWVENLQSAADYNKGFVRFNYSNMEYFDGTQSPVEYIKDYKYEPITGSTFAPGEDYDVDNDIQLWFDDYCLKNGIEGEWARELAFPIFKAGWDAHIDATLPF